MAKSSAKPYRETVQPDLATELAERQAHERAALKAELLRQEQELKVRARFGGGRTRQTLLQVQAELEADEIAKRASEVSSIDQTSTTAEHYGKNISVFETSSELNSYLPKSKLDICHELLRAMANGQELIIPVSQMPRASVSEDARHALAELWAGDIARAEAGLPLRSPDAPMPAASPLTLPDTIPDADKYKPRQGIVEFLETGWPAPYIKAGALSRPELRRLDSKADLALQNWLRDNELPARLRLPKKSELITREVSHVDLEELRNAKRLASALESRERRRARDRN